MHAGARAEWHKLRSVLVHEPGIEVFFALLAPTAHLYERFFNRTAAIEEHRHLCSTLHDIYGVTVHHLERTISTETEWKEDIGAGLKELASRRISQVCTIPDGHATSGDECLIEAAPDLQDRDPDHLLNIITLNPSISISCSGVRTELGHPLHNLYFMRDQQAAMSRGMVQGRMATRERSDETRLSGLALSALGAAPFAKIRRGSFEGGDYLPAGDVVFLGCGMRTSREAVGDLLAGAIDAEEVAVVREPLHPLIGGRDYMVAMHLDTYMNIAADGVAVGNPDLLRAADVEVYQKTGSGYEKSDFSGNLSDFLAGSGFDVIEISTLEQLCYASNFLCVADGECISVDTRALAVSVLERLREKSRLHPGRYEPLLRQAEHDYRVLGTDSEFFPRKRAVRDHGLEMTPVTLTNATGGYGGAHCMTCVISRS